MPQDVEKIKNIIRQSAILSAVEKAEWLQLLPDMSEHQVDELVGILLPKPAAPAAPSAPVAQKSPSQMPKVDITEKEIGTSIPFYEPEIAAHIQSKVPESAKTPSTNPDELKKRVASIVEDLEARRQGKYPGAMPAQPIAPVQPPITATKPALTPVPPVAAQSREKIEPLALKSPADFAKIRAAHLHGTDFADELQKIYDSMLIIAKKATIYDVIQNFEQSPLYKIYIETGVALLNDPNPDRDAAYANAIRTLQAKGTEVLSKDEFEMFTDFRKKLEEVI